MHILHAGMLHMFTFNKAVIKSILTVECQMISVCVLDLTYDSTANHLMCLFRLLLLVSLLTCLH